MTEVKCPVCKTEIFGLLRCDECGFDQLDKAFISVEDAENWRKEVVDPYRLKWEQKTSERYLLCCHHSVRVRQLLDKQSSAGLNRPEHLELLGYLYNVLIKPSDKLKDKDIQRVINLCLENIKQLSFAEDSLVDQFRRLRVSFLQAILNLIDGNLTEAYDLFCLIAEKIDFISIKSKYAFSDAVVMFFFAEVNIHHIKTLAGIEDEEFFLDEKEELAFMGRFWKLQFSVDDYLAVFNYLPRFDETSNPLHVVFDNNGNGVGCMGKNTQWLKVKKYNDNLLLVDYQHWTRQPIKVDYSQLNRHITKNPYKKINGYLHNVMGFSNASE